MIAQIIRPLWCRFWGYLTSPQDLWEPVEYITEPVIIPVIGPVVYPEILPIIPPVSWTAWLGSVPRFEGGRVPPEPEEYIEEYISAPASRFHWDWAEEILERVGLKSPPAPSYFRKHHEVTICTATAHEFIPPFPIGR